MLLKLTDNLTMLKIVMSQLRWAIHSKVKFAASEIGVDILRALIDKSTATLEVLNAILGQSAILTNSGGELKVPCCAGP